MLDVDPMVWFGAHTPYPFPVSYRILKVDFGNFSQLTPLRALHLSA
jgi:hypothetical protein